MSAAEWETRRRHLWATVQAAAATTQRIEQMLIEARRAEDAARDIYYASLKGIPADLAKQYADIEAARTRAALAAIQSKSEAHQAAAVAQEAIEHARRMVEGARQARVQMLRVQ